MDSKRKISNVKYERQEICNVKYYLQNFIFYERNETIQKIKSGFIELFEPL